MNIVILSPRAYWCGFNIQVNRITEEAMFLVVFNPRINYGDDCYFAAECAGLEEVTARIDEWEARIRKKYPNAKMFEWSVYEIAGVKATNLKKAV